MYTDKKLTVQSPLSSLEKTVLFFLPVEVEKTNDYKFSQLKDSLFAEGIKIYLNHQQQDLSYKPIRWGKAKWHAHQFLHLVEKNFDNEHSPAFYAAELNIVESYLREVCKKELKHPPIYWINLRIVAASLIPLFHSDWLVKEIAFEIGIEDVSYFSRLFKKYIGMSPVTFRKHFLD